MYRLLTLMHRLLTLMHRLLPLKEEKQLQVHVRVRALAGMSEALDLILSTTNQNRIKIRS